jgi:hypothetical protein
MKQNGSAKPDFQTDKHPTFFSCGFPFIRRAKMGFRMLNREPKMDPLKQTGWHHAPERALPPIHCNVCGEVSQVFGRERRHPT